MKRAVKQCALVVVGGLFLFLAIELRAPESEPLHAGVPSEPSDADAVASQLVTQPVQESDSPARQAENRLEELVTVLAAESRTPLEDASLRYQGRGAVQDCRPLGEGQFVLFDEKGPGLLLATAPGYQSRLIDRSLVEGELTLEPLGQVTVEIAWPEHAADPLTAELVPGPEVSVVEGTTPGMSDLWNAVPAAHEPEDPADYAIAEVGQLLRTASPGEDLVWSSVVPGRDYRWLTDPPLAVTYDPPHEVTSPIQEGAGNLSPRPDWQRGVSGLFDVEPGSHHRFQLDLEDCATVIGVLAPFEPGSDSSLILRSGVSMANKGTGFMVERELVADETGAFVIEGVSPGSKVICAKWRDSKGHVRFVAKRFLVTTSALCDLGILEPYPSETTVQVKYTQLGEPVDIDEVFQTAPEEMIVSFIGRELVNGDPSVVDLLSLPVREPTRITGLIPGQYAMSFRGVWTGRFRSRWAPVSERTPRYEGSLTEHVQLNLEVEQRYRCQLRFDPPEAASGWQGNAWLWNQDQPSGPARSAYVDQGAGSQVKDSGVIELSPGTYSGLAVLQNPDQANHPGWFWAGEVEMEETTDEVLLTPQLGAGLDVAVVREADGQPLMNGYLAVLVFYSLPELGLDDAQFDLQLSTDDLGRVRLRGLPPGAKVIVPGRGAEALMAGTAGSIEDGQLVWGF